MVLLGLNKSEEVDVVVEDDASLSKSFFDFDEANDGI